MQFYEIDSLSQKIANKKTAEYFQEIVSSFYAKNFRSSVVMLYSVVICDLIYKLQELEENYKDEVAKCILEEIRKQQQKNPNSPAWEKDLIEKLKIKTDFFENSDYENINYLQKCRHLCAHPVIENNNNILYSPNQDTVRAHIVNALEGVLTKPTLFSRKIFDLFISDLQKYKESLFSIKINKEELRKCLVAKYFDKMNKSVKIYLFKNLWKFVFKTSSTECDKNREINSTALSILLTDNKKEIYEYIEKKEKRYFSENIDIKYIDYVIKFMNEHLDLYKLLDDNAKIQIKSTIENKGTTSSSLKYIAVFLYKNLDEHYNFILKLRKKEKDLANESSTQYLLKLDNIKYLSGLYISYGEADKGCGLLAWELSQSNSFNQSIDISRIINEHLSSFNIDLLKKLVNNINENLEIYCCWAVMGENGLSKKIKELILKKEPNFDFSKFEEFNDTISDSPGNKKFRL